MRKLLLSLLLALVGSADISAMQQEQNKDEQATQENKKRLFIVKNILDKEAENKSDSDDILVKVVEAGQAPYPMVIASHDNSAFYKADLRFLFDPAYPHYHLHDLPDGNKG